MRYIPYIQVVLVLAVLPVLAHAAEPEETGAADETGLKILAGVGVRAVDNLFASSTNKVSEVITTGSLGLSMKAAYSRQRLALDAGFNDNRYEAHTDWNYVGSNLAGAWQWSSGTGFHGAANATQVTAQNPAVASAGSTQRNLNTTQTSLVSVGYELSGGWDINTGLVYSSSKNEGTVVGQTNYQYSGTFVGATYTFRSGNALTLTVQGANGSNFYDYTVRSSELKFVSKAEDEVAVTWQIVQWNQSYALHPEFDFSAVGGAATIAWPITSKTSVALSAQRQIYGNPSATSIYSLADSIALTPAWEISPKVTLRGQVLYGVTRDQGDPGGGASGRVDRFETQTVGLYWAQQERLLISTTVGRTERTSNVVGADFIVNQLTLQATYTF